MISKLKYNGFEVLLCSSLLLLFAISTVQAAEQQKTADQKPAGLQIIMDTVKKAVQTKKFKLFKPYVSNKEKLHWAPCGDHGGETVAMFSFDEMVNFLSKFSKGAEIYVYEYPEIHLWDFEKPIVYSINIDTEGWTSEYPYLSFGFKFSPAENRWEWRGVCDSPVPPRHLSKDMKKYEEIDYRQPKLPRPGPRIFKDINALKARIEEIVKYREFDALRPYVIKKTLIFGQCTQKMMDMDRVEGIVTPVDEVIDFLIKNAAGAKKVKFSGVAHITYYETIGWNGEYPFIAFWFSEGKKGWELAGVSYCKTKHFDLLPPLPSLK